ncbi:MAG: hypothetical protein NC253_01780 [Ruminococcus sp.]|nr:hypothetical protein [Ruminococcus sp.]MCM1381205.1 hypothetical protein [Muribaculaceae bacterium]MCM1478725.1 hypothetical protein [Muribaculaceae bacterium]
MSFMTVVKAALGLAAIGGGIAFIHKKMRENNVTDTDKTDIAKAAADDLIKKFNADKDKVINLNDIFNENAKQLKNKSVKTLKKHLGESIVIMGDWDRPKNLRELDEAELWEGEVGATEFTVGAYTVRSSERLYIDDNDEIYYHMRKPASPEKVEEYKKMKRKMGLILRFPDDVRRVYEVSAKLTSDTDGKFDFVCLATETPSGYWTETLYYIASVKASDEAEKEDLFVYKEYMGSERSVEHWYRYSGGEVSKYSIDPYDPDSYEEKWEISE